LTGSEGEVPVAILERAAARLPPVEQVGAAAPRLPPAGRTLEEPGL
jgi:hypothetical protein